MGFRIHEAIQNEISVAIKLLVCMYTHNRVNFEFSVLGISFHDFCVSRRRHLMCVAILFRKLAVVL